MKKSFKILGIIFAVFILLIVIALALVKIFFPPEKVKALLINQMEENLKREVEIQDLSVSIFRGVGVEGLKVSESPTFQQGTFVSSKKFLVRYKLLPLLKKKLVISAVVLEEPRINLTRNLDGNFNFSDLLQAPPEEKEPLPEEEKKAQKAPAFSFLVSRAQIKGGEVNFVDYSPEAMSTKVHQINLDVSGISLVTPMDISLSANLEHKDVSGNLSFDGKLDLDKGVLRIDKFLPSYSDMSLTITGRVENFKEKPKLNITIRDEKILLDNISKIFPLPEGMVLTGSPHFKVDISGLMDDVLIRADANVDDVAIKFQDVFDKERGEKCGLKFEAGLKDNDRLALKWSSLYMEGFAIAASGEVRGLKAPPPNLNITIETHESELGELVKFLPSAKDFHLSGKVGVACNIKGVLPKKLHFVGESSLDNAYLLFNKHELKSLKAPKIEFSDTEFNIPRLRGIWNGAHFSLSCKVKEFTLDLIQCPYRQKFISPRISFDFRLSKLDIDKILATLPTPQVGEKGRGAPSKPSPPPPIVNKIIKGIKINGDLKIDKITYEDFILSNAEAKINMRQGKLEIKPFSLNGYEGTLSGELGANFQTLDDIRFTTAINLKNLSLNPAVMDLHPQRIAKIYGKASFGSTLYGEFAKIPGSLAGSGYLNIEKGKIESGIPLLEKLAKLLGKPQFQTLLFTELKGHYKLENKRITTKDLQMIGNDLSFDAQGWADLDMKLNFNVTARMSENLLSESIRQHIVKDEQGRSMLFLVVKGKVNKPKIGIDVKKTTTAQAKQKVKDAVLDKVLGEEEGELRKTLEKGLDKIFKFK